MAPVAQIIVATLLAISEVTNAKPVGGAHRAPAVYNLGLGKRMKRGLRNLADRYYGDSQGLTRPSPLQERRATVLPAGWTSVGCMNESSGQRLLQGTSFISSSMTPLLCMSQCQKAGYTYAGNEYSDECYCGNSFVGSGGKVQPAASCSMSCAGDSTSMCGASWFLSVYQYTASSTCDPSASTTAAPSATSAAHPTYTDPVDASQWYNLGCAVDSSTRLLSGFFTNSNSMTIDTCLGLCEDKGFGFGGVEYGNQCYCGASLPVNITWADNLCNVPCAGNSKETCGGGWGLEVYELISSANNGTDCPVENVASVSASKIGNGLIAVPSASKSLLLGGNAATSTIRTTTTAAPTTTVAAVTTAVTTTQAGSAVAPAPTNNIPSTSNTNQVWAHHMVGNTYPYGVSDWLTDIKAASAQGIDGFALNMGIDSWQPARINDAYSAAQQSGLNFKLFLSLDMTSLGCWSSNDATNLVNLVKTWANHPNQAHHNGNVLVSTFAGSDCNFGTGQGSNSWQTMFVNPLGSSGINIAFMPSIFSDISTFGGNSWMQGELNWNSAWPMGNNQISTDTDHAYMNALGNKEYMAAVSPFFYTHYGADLWNKNWLYRGDDWMYCTRWEQLISMRNSIKQVEILTWNDYGESSYIGPIHGAMPGYADRWVNGMDHLGLSVLTQYYATAYKTGSYPAITKDSIVIWSRPHSFNANANDYIGKPAGWDWTTDYVWAVVLTTQPSTVTLTSGSNTQTFNVQAGLSKLKIANSPGGASGAITRNGNSVASTSLANFSWTTTPALYNYNYQVASSS